MKGMLPIGLAVIIVAAVASCAITRDGALVTPEGTGTVTADAGTFEAFALPDYAAAVLTDDYKSYFIEVEPGIKIHMLEVGSGYPVYLQHGNPTNGLLYRKVAAELPTERMRVIMPTMVGLGFSSKVPASQHSLENHIRWMNAALEQLDLGGVVYVGQDWGGAVGMGALAQSPDWLEGAVILNTGWSAPTGKRDLSRVHAMAKTPVLGELLLERLVSIFDRLHETQGDPASMPKEVANLYRLPVTQGGNRKAPLALMRMVPDGPDHPSTAQLIAIEAYVDTLDIPAEIVWGMRDPIFAQALPIMQDFFPDASVTQTEAGHFLQEEVAQDIARAIERVVNAVNAEMEAVRVVDQPGQN